MAKVFFFLVLTAWIYRHCLANSSYDYSSSDHETITCAYPEAGVNRSTINVGEPNISKNGSEWTLTYNITWQPPVLEGVDVDWNYKVNITQTEQLKYLSSWECDGHEITDRTIDVTEPYYVVNLLFTYQTLFQVLVVAEGNIVSDKIATSGAFDTPDCYEVTGDADFCSSQGVTFCGAPYGLNLLNVTEYLEDGLVVPTLEWYAPVQVNKLMSVVSYTATIRLYEDTEWVQKVHVKHEENVTYYSWTADGSGKEDLPLQNATQYIFKVVPVVAEMGASKAEEGRAAELIFWTNTTVTVTPPPTTPSGPLTDVQVGASNSVWVNLIFILCVIIIAALVVLIIAKKKGLFQKEVIEEVFYRIERAKGDEFTGALDRVDPALKPKEITHDRITLQEELGKGQFGIVYKGLVYGLEGDQDYVEVAVKTTKDGAFDDVKEDLLDEMKLMIQLGSHPNLMTLLACCTQREPFYLITEFMQYGDLLGFLRRCREEKYVEKDNIYNISEIEQIGMAHQIAKGMAYVQDERFYHGDLAARNVLVGRGMNLKISDFGLADDIYSRGYKRREQEQKIPIKWCSLEAILNGICSSEGDVWSYGVVLYEIFTLGGTPYPGIAGRFLVAQLKEGYRMDQPEGCPDEIYKIMLQCWQEDAESRPRFQEINDEVDAMLVERSDYLSFDMDDDGEEFDEDSGSSRPLSIPNIYVKAPGLPAKQPETFAPIIEEDNEIGLEELQEIIHSDLNDKDSNDNEKIQV